MRPCVLTAACLGLLLVTIPPASASSMDVTCAGYVLSSAGLQPSASCNQFDGENTTRIEVIFNDGIEKLLADQAFLLSLWSDFVIVVPFVSESYEEPKTRLPAPPAGWESASTWLGI